MVGLSGRLPSLRTTSVWIVTTCSWLRAVFADVSVLSASAVIPANGPLVADGSGPCRRCVVRTEPIPVAATEPKTSVVAAFVPRRGRVDRRVEGCFTVGSEVDSAEGGGAGGTTEGGVSVAILGGPGGLGSTIGCSGSTFVIGTAEGGTGSGLGSFGGMDGIGGLAETIARSGG